MRYELHTKHGVWIDSLQELRKVIQDTEGDWVLYEIFESTMDDIKVSPYNKLSLSEYKQIWQLRSNGWGIWALASEFNIAFETVKKILRDEFHIRKKYESSIKLINELKNAKDYSNNSIF